jgi:2-polyprenyl-3-methyl-5-hydroxy-6-metoxy-1,4-benzoquinol methylase
VQKLAEIAQFAASDWTKRIPSACFIDRDDEIIKQCRGKSVLHVGAADAPFGIDKGRVGALLHQKIQKVVQRLVGVDVDSKAIEALRAFGIDNIVCADVCASDPFPGDVFDVILCCDVIEHVLSPGVLLAACRRYMGEDTKLVVTTINATALKPALRAFAGRESVHTDHVAYYSFATLGKLLTVAELRPVEFGVFAYPTVNPIAGWLTARVMRIVPGSADGIMMNARRL